MKCNICGFDESVGENFTGIFANGVNLSTTTGEECALFACPKCNTIKFTTDVNYIRMRKREDNCPESILNLLSLTDNEYAISWRNRCRANAHAKKSPYSLSKLPVGSIIQFLEPISGETIELRKHPAAYQFKRPFWINDKEFKYYSPNRIPKFYTVIKIG